MVELPYYGYGRLRFGIVHHFEHFYRWELLMVITRRTCICLFADDFVKEEEWEEQCVFAIA